MPPGINSRENRRQNRIFWEYRSNYTCGPYRGNVCSAVHTGKPSALVPQAGKQDHFRISHIDAAMKMPTSLQIFKLLPPWYFTPLKP